MSVEPIILESGLRLHYGRLEEILKKDTVFLDIYLAWDTRSLLVGNRTGQKVPFSNSGYSKTEIDGLLDVFRQELNNTNEQLILSFESLSQNHQQIIDSIIEDSKQALLEEVRLEIVSEMTDKINEATSDIVTNISENREFWEGIINEVIDLDKVVLISKLSTDDLSYHNDILKAPKVKGDQLYVGNEEILPFDYAKEVNSKKVVNNEVRIDLSDIGETTDLKVNTLLPDQHGRINARSNEDQEMGRDSIVFGEGSLALGVGAVAIGAGAISNLDGSIQLGEGTNNDENSLKFRSHTLIKDGIIPEQRIEDKWFYVEDLEVFWDDTRLERTIILEGLTEDSIIWFSSSPKDDTALAEFNKRKVRAVSQRNGELDLKVESVPTESLLLNISWRVPRRSET